MKITPDFILTTNRLLLRQPTAADIPHVFSASRFPGFTDGMLWEPPEQLEELLAPLQNNIKDWEKGKGYTFTIETPEDSTFLGRISIRITNEPNRWNVGFWTHPEQQGTGVMTEALGAVLDFGFQQLQAQVIEACHATWNKASEKVLLRNGMQFVRYIEKGYQKKGVWVPEHLLEIRAEDHRSD